MTGVEVIGTPKEDDAINVYFDELETSYWFDKDLLEHVEDGKETVITLSGISKKWTKKENGDWVEERDSSNNETELKKERPQRKWWKFWDF